MSADEIDQPEDTQKTRPEEEPIPIGIARIREEWREEGLSQEEPGRAERVEQPVIFPAADEGAGVGDYTLDLDTVREQLPFSDDAIDRLIASGELDSVLVRGPDGVPRRMVSESSFKRFQEDAAIDPEAMARAARAMADKSLAQAIEDLHAAVEDLRSNQSRVLQQMKDILLLEVRNLKEQDRDLASFVFELAEQIRRILPEKRR
ncbi:MAG: hypothetical protein ACP5R5_02600 [Armatimonadota bacterium]